MVPKRIRLVAVHSGHFHADDVFSIAVLKLLYPKVKIVRTRDPKLYNKADLRVDVGGRYDPVHGDFDHHQKGGAGKRSNGIPYASVGLIWKHFGKKLVGSDEIWQIIDTKIVQGLDAEDNGIMSYKVERAEPYALGEVIETFNPFWQKEEKSGDREFGRAVKLLMDLLEMEISAAKVVVDAKRKIRRIVRKAGLSAKYIVIGDYLPWKEAVAEYPKLLYVVFFANRSWLVRSVLVKGDKFGVKKPLPKKWAGLNDKELAKVCGVKDAVFCHRDRFIAGAKTKGGAIKMAELAVRA